MDAINAWFNSPRGHAAVSVALFTVSQFFPAYAGLLTTIATAFGYGAVVSASPAAPAK